MPASRSMMRLCGEPHGRATPRRLAIWLTVACVLVAGCGRGSKLRRLPLAGRVTFAGEPVEDGLIEFIPVDATPGSSFGGVVKAGRYAVRAAPLPRRPPGFRPGLFGETRKRRDFPKKPGAEATG